jgi:hypothetical protein
MCAQSAPFNPIEENLRGRVNHSSIMRRGALHNTTV